MRRRWKPAATPLLAIAEAVLVGSGAIAFAVATANPPQWPGWLRWLPIHPAFAAVTCVVGAAVLAAASLRRKHVYGRSALLAAAEAAAVGLGAIAINAATGAPPGWPGWLGWIPTSPVPIALASIILGIWIAVARTRPEPVRVRRVWALPRPDPADLARPELTEQVTTQLVEAEGGTVGLTTALVGAGGFGKTTLARLIGQDRRVRRQFRSAVWVNLGQEVKGGDLANAINDVYEQLTRIRPSFTDPDQAGQHLGELLSAGGRVLLIIDDVWRSTQLGPFLHNGHRVTRLVTTRRPDALPAAARGLGVRVDELSDEQALTLLTADLPALPQQELARLLRLTGRWPLLVRLANAHLATTIRVGTPTDQAATRLAERLEEDGPDTLSLTDEASRDKAAAASINASLDLLAPTRDDPVDGRGLFEKLAVFAEDAVIDRTTLLILWGDTLSEGQVDRLCERLAGLSLLADHKPGVAVRLHDVVLAYLRTRMRTQLPRLHALVVSGAHSLLSIQDHGEPPAWWLLPPHADYVWQHLCEHLAQADQHQLTTLLGDLRWAEARIRRDGTAALDADYSHSNDPTPTRLRRAIARDAHHFTATHATGRWWLADTLLDRLHGTPGLDTAIETYRAGLPPHLRDKLRNPPADRPEPALRHILTGHASVVEACAIAPDGSWLVTTSRDGTARVWEAATGAPRHTLIGHTDWVNACAIAPDGSWLVTTSRDGTARIWQAATGALRQILTDHTGCVDLCAIAADGAQLVTTHVDGTARTWDAVLGIVLRTLPDEPNSADASAVASNGNFVVTTRLGGPTQVWETASGALRNSLHDSNVDLCMVAPDGSWLMTVDFDGTARIWDLCTGTARHTLPNNTDWVATGMIAPNGTWLVTGDFDGTARIWDPAVGSLRRNLTGHADTVTSCAIAPDSTWMATTSADNTIRIWDVP